MNTVRNPLLPPQEYIATLPLQSANQIPYIIAGDVACVVGFSGLFVGLIMQALIAEAVIVSLSICLFVLSLIMIKRCKLEIGSYLITSALLLACAVVLYFGGFYNTTFLIYRNAFFIVVMTICNQIVSVKRRQLYVFTGVSVALWIGDWFTVFTPFYGTDHPIVAVAFINNFAIIISNAIIILVNRFNGKLVEEAEKQKNDSEEALKKITAVFAESKNGLNVGKRLNESANAATASVERIKDLSRYLIDESAKLSEETITVKDSGTQIAGQSEQMKASVHEQAASINETSAAMTEISANIANINKIASAQRTGMDEIMKSLDAQNSLLSELVNQVTKVKTSSDGIATFVNTIDNISSQTSLLAMNASIEAAHAGAYGKGFSVIAQEIRKLSEETTKSAARISDTLKENTAIVQNTTASVNSFASYTQKSATELRSTIEAVEAILAGINEMNTGTQDVMKALQTIVDGSQTSSDLVENVVCEISGQKEALEQISAFSGSLRERTAGLDDILNAIEAAIGHIQAEAAENISVGKKISESVNI